MCDLLASAVDLLLVPCGLRIADSPTGAGRGVFATRAFAVGETIETCPMLIVDDERGEALSDGADGYVFRWGDSATALALGYGSLYNHHFEPNATTTEAGEELVVTALRDIAVGDEIFINYLGTAVDPDAVWFDDVHS